MVILEFMSQKNFNTASRILKTHNIPFRSERSVDDWHPNLIYFFEPDIRTNIQWEALSRARTLEREEQHKQVRSVLPNLAVPQ